MINTNKPVSILICGCGAISELYYLPALSELERSGQVRVVGFFDPCTDRLAAFRVAFPSATAFINWETFLAMPADAAIIASPQKFHAAQTIALLRRGCHVLCEKPMASSAGEAVAMVEAAAAA